MLKSKLLFALALVSFLQLKAQYQTHLLSYTTLCMSTPDMDGDGDKDILTGGLSNLQWQENIGGRQFISHTIGQKQDQVQSAIAADLDKDGDMDVVTASFTDDRVYWMRNDGNNVFTSIVLSNSATGAASVDVIDLDSDGDSDVVCAAFGDDKIFWLQNNGSQSFTAIDILTGFDGPNTVVSNDFDMDGDMDLAAASQLDSTIVWLENDSNQQFTSHILISNLNIPRNISLCDVDRDNDMDLMYGSSAGSGWFTNTAGTFIRRNMASGEFRDIYAVDLNNDAQNDVLLADYADDRLTWIRNTGNLTFVLGDYLDFALDNVSMVGAADFDGDGNMDVIGASGFDVKVYWNSPTHVFTKFRLNRYLSDANYACHGDFDNDGDIDLLAAGYANINFYRNDSNGVFTTLPVFPLYSSMGCRQIRAADIDGDGDMDAVYTENNGNRVSWLENQGAGVFVDHLLVSIIDPYAVYPIDFDFDGDMDVVASTVQSTSTAKVLWFENDGNEIFTQHLVDASYHYPLDVFPLDYDQDGFMDVVAAYAGTAGSQKVVVHYNSATGFNFNNWELNGSASGVNSVFAVDVDGDNDVDVLSASFGDNRVMWYESPAGTEHIIDNNAQGATYVYAADFDGDGDIDVASTSRTDDEINWYRNGGNQGFTKINIAENIPDPEVILGADFDNDGILELYSTCSSSESVAYYKLPAPQPPLVLNDCSDLFISEYIEGTSNNKAIELYNPTADTIDLSGYQINVYTNGNGSPNQSVNLSGTILPLDVYVLAHPSANAGILNIADTTFGFSFNGDDAIALFKDGRALDIFGKIAQDPGTEWSSVGVSTLNTTLVRNPTFAKGNNLNAAFDPSIEWIPFSTDNISNLGSHSSLCSSYCPPVIAIVASEDTICANTVVSFSSSVQNEGTLPHYQWKINGAPVGSDSAGFSTSNLNNGDEVTCTLTSDLPCSISPVHSNAIKFKVYPLVQPGISISTPSTVLCSAAPITFTAISTNGGASPNYLWKKNGIPVGSNSASFTLNTPTDQDSITCTLISSVRCASIDSLTSNTIKLTISSNLNVSVSITASNTSSCAGDTIHFTATPVNGGATPSYQWTKNNNPILGATASTYSTSTAANGNTFACILTSSFPCTVNPVANSNVIPVSVSPTVTPSVSIASNMNIICKDQSITFTATPTNGGTAPSYVWKKNGTPIPGATTANYTTTTLANGNSISCTMSSNATCKTSNTADSNPLSIQVLALPTVVATANGNLLSTGSFVFYQWLRNNVPISGATNQTYTATQNGNYRVIGWSGTTGCNDTSNTLAIINVGVSSIHSTEVLTIQPNPSNGIFYLAFTGNTAKKITVMNLIGKTIFATILQADKNTFMLDLTGYSKSVYFLTVEEGSTKIVRRLVIE
ncbi:MAG: VCBS repeat-containing protein [Bacteroidetes bacterium]|nr:VCBS repeat-containing protein [Bacteroidota bacterium]